MSSSSTAPTQAPRGSATVAPATVGEGRGPETQLGPTVHVGGSSLAPAASRPAAPGDRGAIGDTGPLDDAVSFDHGGGGDHGGADDDTADDVDAADSGAPRQVRLTVGRVDPWSVLKLSFLVSVALGIALVVMMGVLWSVLQGMGVFADLDSVVGEVVGAESAFSLTDVLGRSRVLSLTVVVAVVDVVLLTALSTLAAVLYNICSALVGGVRLTLTDD